MNVLPLAAHAARWVTGARRASLQDRHVVDGDLGFVLLADGVAGRPSGARAAEIAIDAASAQLGLALRNRWLDPSCSVTTLVGDAFQLANLAVYRAASTDETLRNMATTLVGAVFVERCAVIGNLGDSRAYRLRHGRLEQVTCDHVVDHVGVAHLTAADGAAIRPFVQRLSRVVGDQEEALPDLRVEFLRPEDVFLFCSNGLSDALPAAEIEQTLRECDSLEDTCERLISAAVAAGAEDDVTVVLARPRLPLPREAR